MFTLKTSQIAILSLVMLVTACAGTPTSQGTPSAIYTSASYTSPASTIPLYSQGTGF